MFLVRRVGQEGWRVPKTSAYSDEAALQAIVANSPTLLPGEGGAPVVIVTEMEIDAARYPDVIGVDESGEITIVECKLRANSEIRRAVVGQVLSYASGLWGLSYEEFGARFSARTSHGGSLADQMRACASPDWDEEAFREAVAASLAAGRFHLVIAVDEITEELKGIIRYLNARTGSDLLLVALELRYIADDGFEILIPAVYGQESVDQKVAASARHRWDEQSLLDALEAICPPPALLGVRRVFEYVKGHGGGCLGGTARNASAGARMVVHGRQLTVFNFYADPPERPVFSLNFEYLASVCSKLEMTNFVVRLREIPELARYLNGLEEASFKKRPSIPINEVLGAPDVVETMLNALDEFTNGGVS